MNDYRYGEPRYPVYIYRRQNFFVRKFCAVRKKIEAKWTKFLKSSKADRFGWLMIRLIVVLEITAFALIGYDLYYRLFIEEIG